MIDKLKIASWLLLVPIVVHAQTASDHGQYISDQITVSMRDQPSNTAAVVGSVKSGDPVKLIETLGDQSFAHIRTHDGAEGWITARYLSSTPAARDQLVQTQKALDAAHAQTEKLQAQLDSAQKQLGDAKPALELADDNKKLQATLADQQRAAAELERRYNQEEAQRRTLMTGAGLVGAGIACGLLLPWIGRLGRKRRRGEL